MGSLGGERGCLAPDSAHAQRSLASAMLFSKSAMDRLRQSSILGIEM